MLFQILQQGGHRITAGVRSVGIGNALPPCPPLLSLDVLPGEGYLALGHATDIAKAAAVASVDQVGEDASVTDGSAF